LHEFKTPCEAIAFLPAHSITNALWPKRPPAAGAHSICWYRKHRYDAAKSATARETARKELTIQEVTD
jgi:hypothetical protein